MLFVVVVVGGGGFFFFFESLSQYKVETKYRQNKYKL